MATTTLHLLGRVRAALAVCGLVSVLNLAAAEPFTWRGYYLTFMRMPVMGLPEWKEAIDCFAEDDANIIILWTAGGFRSKKFPVTWAYNDEHANVRKDFVRELIDYAHSRQIRVLLGFTPFGYDGVNRFPLAQPELKARKKDGTPVDEFGIHCRGWNLCPAKAESQRLMHEYIREMVFDFYPNADGLLVESSDYGICHCPQCGPRYYEHEFAFVQALSEEVWKRNTNALLLVYPHYFTGRIVPGLETVAAKQPFDGRWGLFFTPHSAHFDAALIAKAKTSVFWSDAPVLRRPQDIAQGTRLARQQGVSGFVPSLEAFSYVAQGPDGGEPWLIGKRLKPWGLNAQGEGRMPYRFLVPRVQRLAFREFSRAPQLTLEDFKRCLGEHLFGKDATAQRVDDALELQRIWTHGSEWYWASPLLDPELFRARAKRLKWPAATLQEYDANLARLRNIAERYQPSMHPVDREMAQMADAVVRRWDGMLPSESK